MEVKMIPKQENIPDFDTKAIQIKHIDSNFAHRF